MQGFGIHAHFVHEESHDAVEHAQPAAYEHGVTIVSDHASGHATSHLQDGTVDMDVPANAVGKISYLLMLAVLSAALLLTLRFAVIRSVWSGPARTRTRRRRSHLLPPSQAPPVIA